MNSFQEDYAKVGKQSFVGKDDGLTIHAQFLHGIYHCPIGFQPMGISSRRVGDKSDEVVIASYLECAFYRMHVSRDATGLHFTGIQRVSRARHGIHNVPLFPEVSRRGDNRLQTVNFSPTANGMPLVISANQGDCLYLLNKVGDQFEVVGKTELPKGREGFVIHSVAISGTSVPHMDILQTIESGVNLAFPWMHMMYDFSPVDQYRLRSTTILRKLPEWVYSGSDSSTRLWFVADMRSLLNTGVYYNGLKETDLRVPNINGNGICFLSDGSALVTFYGGQSSHAFGLPGELIYIPSEFFKSQ